MIRFFLLSVLFLSVVGCGDDGTSTSQKESESATVADTATSTVDTIPQEPVVVVEPIDTQAQALAYYLAGMVPEDTTMLNGAFQDPAWKAYHADLDAAWARLEEVRFSKLKAWQAEVLSTYTYDTTALFYPFSGPDFLHANAFYPNATKYYFIAIEPVFELPDIANFTSAEHKSFLASMHTSFRDILSKSYFITTHMMSDLQAQKADGVLPILYAFLARTGHEIVEVFPVDVGTGVVETHDSLSYEKNQAVRFRFRKKGSTYRQSLTYFNRSISDRDLDNKHPEFKTYLANLAPAYNSFVKAASYLMHYEGFSYVREAVLSKCLSLFQDDTGVPLRYMDTAHWDIHLFGDYTRPIKDFSDMMYQSDLNTLYDETPEAEKGTIPFSLGYHIVGDKIQNHQILVRKDMAETNKTQ